MCSSLLTAVRALSAPLQLIKKAGIHSGGAKSSGWKEKSGHRDFPKFASWTERVISAHKKYIDENPVKAGLAKSADEYPYCSAYLRKKEKASG